jgi:cold-inducible RNA-binding protein
MNKIYVGNLPFQTTKQDLEREFQQFGKMKEIALITDNNSNKFRGFAFITFVSAESAQQAIGSNGKDFQGRAMTVSIARTEEKAKSLSNKMRDRNKKGSSHRGYRGGFQNNRAGSRR